MNPTEDLLKTMKLVLIPLTFLAVGAVGTALLAPRFAPERTPAPMARFAVSQGEVRAASPREVPPELLREPLPGGSPLTSPFTAVAERVIPAVVSVEGRRTMTHPPVEGQDEDFFDRFFPRREGSEGGDNEIEIPSSGSGFIIDPTGYVLTNDHVVTEAEHINVHLADGRTYDVRLVGTDPGTDVAVLKIDLPAGDAPLPVLPLGNSEEIRVGDWAIVVGNPLGELESSFTVGVISAKGRTDLRIAGGGPIYQDFLQTDASINFGNSGGPLVNIRGEAVGINSAVNPGGQGLGFAIPMDLAREVAVKLIRTGTVSRGYLGIVPAPLSAELMADWSLAEGDGILVFSVEDGSPADQGGLEAGDIILRFNERSSRDVADFRRIVAEAGVGADVPIQVLRDGDRKQLHVVLVERPDTPTPPATREPSDPMNWLGVAPRDIGEDLARVFDLTRRQGVVLAEVDPEGPGAEAGLRTGDVVLKVAGEDVGSVEEFDRVLAGTAEGDEAVVLLVERGEDTRFIAVPRRQ